MNNIERQSQTEKKSTGSQAQKETPKEAPRNQSKSAMSAARIALVGGVVAAAVVVGVLLSGNDEAIGTKDRPALSLVAATQVDQAAGTLDPEKKTQIVEEAKACKAPLAIMRITKADGGGTVRIRAGSYLSPPFVAGDTPIDVAIPFPAPFETGKGEISIEGVAKGVEVQLSPDINIDTTAGAIKIPVWWKTDKPCGS